MVKKGKKKRELPLIQSAALKAELEKLKKKTYTGERDSGQVIRVLFGKGRKK